MFDDAFMEEKEKAEQNKRKKKRRLKRSEMK